MNHLPITVLGLNPAWQKTLFFTHFRPGEVNRADRSTTFASGKGINFCRAADTWGTPALLLQFSGGWTGEQIELELNAEHLRHRSVRAEASTRICTTCLCCSTNTMTELIEPSGEISPAEEQALQRALAAELKQSSGLAVCGTYPPGISEELYVEAVRTAKANKLPVMVDSWRNIDRLIRQESFDLLKINAEELHGITGQSDVPTALRYCHDHFPARFYAITDGGRDAWFGDGQRLLSYQLPRIKVINPVGAGDTVAAVMFAEYRQGAAWEEAFAVGLAAASVSCTEIKCAVFNPTQVKAMRERIVVTVRVP